MYYGVFFLKIGQNSFLKFLLILSQRQVKLQILEVIISVIIFLQASIKFKRILSLCIFCLF